MYFICQNPFRLQIVVKSITKQASLDSTEDQPQRGRPIEKEANTARPVRAATLDVSERPLMIDGLDGNCPAKHPQNVIRIMLRQTVSHGNKKTHWIPLMADSVVKSDITIWQPCC